MAHVEVLDETSRYPRVEGLRRVVGAYLDEAGLGEREVTIVLLDDAAIAERNLADRGVAGPTDVLSYPTFEPTGLWFPSVAHLGDVLVSLDTAERQARERGHALAEEVLLLVAHGVVHLLGHDHPDEASWSPFLAAQKRVLELAEELAP